MDSEIKIFFRIECPWAFFAQKKQKSNTFFPIKRPGRFSGKLRYGTPWAFFFRKTPVRPGRFFSRKTPVPLLLNGVEMCSQISV